MSQPFGNAFLKPPQKGGGLVISRPGAAPPAGAKPPAQKPADRKLTFTKILRWCLPEGGTEEPAIVEVAGTFTGWKKVPLIYDGAMRSWQVTLQNIPGNRTHRYMLLVDGKPVEDAHSDGMAVPSGTQEREFAIETARGPRVFMLFSQTK